MIKHLYILIFGLIFIAAYFVLQALVAYTVAPKPQAITPTYSVSADATFPLTPDTKNEETPQERAARKEAIDKARVKAEEVAKQLGMKLGKVTYINEYVSRGDQLPYPVDGQGSPLTTPTKPQEGTVSVNLTYELTQ